MSIDPQGLIVGGFALLYGVTVLRQPAKRAAEAEAAANPALAPTPAQIRTLRIKGGILVTLALAILATAVLRHH